jgi:hypothetical protein
MEKWTIFTWLKLVVFIGGIRADRIQTASILLLEENTETFKEILISTMNCHK